MPYGNRPQHSDRWVVEHRAQHATIVLPFGTDASDWVEVTRVGDRYARFITPQGDHVDCAKYAEMAEQEAGL